MGVEQRDKKLLRRALALFQNSCLLIGQNNDEHISDLSIKIAMADVYSMLDEHEHALEILQKNNPCNLNSPMIGNILSRIAGRESEAIPYLSEALIDVFTAQLRIVTGYLNVYAKRGEWSKSLLMLEWHLSSLQSLTEGNRPNIIEKIASTMTAVKGYVHFKLGECETAKSALREAKAMAEHFDSVPCYDVDDVPFVEMGNRSTAHDSLGKTAMDGVQFAVDEEHSSEFCAMWEEIKNE